MSALLAQGLIAVPFLVLGAWCLLLPQMVERLGSTPEYYHGTPTTALMMGCFGAQAVLSGLFAWFSRFTRTSFVVYAIALLPLFWFNCWFVFVVPMFNQWMLLDFGVNVAMLTLCVIGYRATPKPAER